MNIIKVEILNYNSKVKVIIENHPKKEINHKIKNTNSSANRTNRSWWDDSPSVCGMYVSDLY